MRSLYDLMTDPGERRRGDSLLTEEQFRFTLEGAAPVFRESSKRDAVPVTIVNDPGVLVSRHINVLDVNAADHGMRGTGGTYDRADQATTDIQALAIWKNVEVPWRLMQSSDRAGFNLWLESVKAASQRVAEKENTYIVKGLGANKGLTTTVGIQTFGSAGAWTSPGVAYDDIVTAVVDKFGTEKVPEGFGALMVHPTRRANLYKTFTNTDSAQLEKIKALLPGGIHSSLDCPTDKAYVYAKTPTVLEHRVYQDLSVIQLPQTDEDFRARTRVIGAFHAKKPKGIVEITSIDV